MTLSREEWPLRHPFVVSRRTVTTVETMTIHLEREGHVGRGEASGLYYEGETLDALERTAREAVAAAGPDLSPAWLQAHVPPCGARAALDCALWDWMSKNSSVFAHNVAKLDAIDPLETAITISRGPAEEMAERARALAGVSVLKLKVGGAGDLSADLDRIAAVRAAVGPAPRFIVDPNTAWSAQDVREADGALAALGVSLLEQPFPPGAECALRASDCVTPLCADEAIKTRADLGALAPAYSAINIKLEKCGGLTEALALAAAARARGLKIMVGCMNGTSLAMAPAMIVAQGADFVDLDGPFDMTRDRDPPIHYSRGLMHPPSRALWG